MSCAESAMINAPIEKVRRQCSQPGFLARMLPGITGLRQLAPGIYSCGLDFPRMPATARLRVEDDGDHLRITSDEPRCAITVELTEQDPNRTAMGVRVDVSPRSREQHTHIARALQDGVENIRAYLATEPGVPDPRRGRRDPLLHTGPRVPPDFLAHRPHRS